MDLPQKERFFAEKSPNPCICPKFVVLLQRKSLYNKIMEAQLQQNYQARKYHSLDEFADKLAKKLGQHYGMNDIRDLLQ